MRNSGLGAAAGAAEQPQLVRAYGATASCGNDAEPGGELGSGRAAGASAHERLGPGSVARTSPDRDIQLSSRRA